jgi:DNA polymerase-3 subunit gamma/tau
VAPDRPELTSFSPASRGALPDLAGRLGPQRLLRWQQGLRGSEAQLRQSAQPRLWLEVLLLGLLAEPAQVAVAAPAAPSPVPTASSSPSPTVPAPPAPAPPAPSPPAAPSPSPLADDLAALWQQMLANLELPSTRMLLSQQAELVRLDAQRAVVRVAPNWLSMVQTRLPLLEQAAERTLGGARQVLLESGQPQPAPQPVARAAAPTASPTTQPQPPTPQVPPAQADALPPSPSPSPPAPSMAPQSYTEDRLRSHARRLADFFNGDVVVEPEAEGDGEAA